MNNTQIYPFERNRYYPKKRLSSADYQAEQDYFNNKRRFLNGLMYGSGIVCGLGVFSLDDPSILVESGVAIDGLGREVVVETSDVKKLSALSGFDSLRGNEALLCLRYKEEPVHKVYAIESSDPEKEFQYNHVKEGYELFLDFILRCDTILVNYIVQSLLDGLIVGVVNAIFMAFCRMPYIGLISVVVGITNLIPNFGPIIGAVIGGFILLLVNPMQALMFLVFTLVLQFVDGYILKPKLFSNSLGVSGLLILISTIVLGNMFGILGILLSIPAAAVLSFAYNDYFVPWKEKRNNRA